MKAKNLIKWGPEIYLVLATLYYWFLTSNFLNPFAIALLCTLTYQLIVKNAISGVIIASIFIVLNLYMVLALISELSEFPAPNNEWLQMLVVGSVFLGLNITAGSVMFWKYLKAGYTDNVDLAVRK